MTGPGNSARCAVRRALGPDAARVSAIDSEASALPGALFERAAPDELERGVDAGNVWVAECPEGIVGYVHIDRGRDRIYLTGMVVIPGMRGRGLGASLLAAAVASTERTELPVCTVTNPRNLTMVRTLLTQGFVGRWALPDYFGPEQHRVGFQLHGPDRRRPAAQCWYQCSDIDAWVEIIDSGYAVVAADVGGEIPLLGVTPSPTLTVPPCARPEYPGRSYAATAVSRPRISRTAARPARLAPTVLAEGP